MLSLAAFKYRNVLAAHGGPIAGITTGRIPVRGREFTLANATLKPEFTRRTPMALFSATADGTGVHEVPSVARHIAVSEALERWAFHATYRSERAAEFAFDIDPSSCGMSAFPGLFGRQSRKKSVIEAIERYSLICWWEGRAEGRLFDTDWPGVSAVAIDGPFGGITVVVWARTSWGGYVYGHAADESFSGACERAVFELARHEWVMRSWWLSRVAGAPKNPVNIFEQRMVFFGSPDGHDAFLQRVHRPRGCAMPSPEVMCDREIPGPWSEYATVWRFALRPPSNGYISGGPEYFFL